MKLKKVVSLALAGVMAVSMLAGCNFENGGSANSGETETDASTGYSAKFAEYVEDIAELDNVTFKDSATDIAALKAAAGYWSDSAIVDFCRQSSFDKILGNNSSAFEFIDKAGIMKPADYSNVNGYGFAGGKAFSEGHIDDNYMNSTLKMGRAYAVDASIDMEKALQLVADDLETQIDATKMPANAKRTDGSGSYDYSYVVSVSVVNRAAGKTIIASDCAVNLIAVTVTRTGTPHKV